MSVKLAVVLTVLTVLVAGALMLLAKTVMS
jgi:hypothetical protein